MKERGEEKELADSYAKLYEQSFDEAFKKALFEKFEDEYDIAVADEAYREYVADGKKSCPLSKRKKSWNYDVQSRNQPTI